MYIEHRSLQPKIWVLNIIWFFLPVSLMCFIIKAAPVTLLDYKGQTYHTIAWRARKTLVCWVFPHTRVGVLILLPDGTVKDPEYNESYIEHWLPTNTEERTFMVLQGAKGFDCPKLARWDYRFLDYFCNRFIVDSHSSEKWTFKILNYFCKRLR